MPDHPFMDELGLITVSLQAYGSTSDKVCYNISLTRSGRSVRGVWLLAMHLKW
jgi:hypothetical protein